MNSSKRIRVFLVDDHPLLRIGLRLSLSSHSDIEVVGEAENGFIAVERILTHKPDLALIDMDMPGLSGSEVIRILRKSVLGLKIAVLSNYNDEKFIKDAMKAGADGYILKNIDAKDLIKLIKSLYLGEQPLSPYLVNLSIEYGEENGVKVDKSDSLLTIREKEVLKCITDGKRNRDIANELYVSLETVKSHIRSIFRKLNVKNRVEAANKSLNENILG